MTFKSDNADKQITFDELCDIYVEIGSFSSPSELHGQLCGQLSAGQRLESADWLKAATDQMAIESILSVSVEEFLMTLYQSTYQELLSPDMSFSLFLPEDSDPMNVRLECLSQWCHGFLAGYGLGGISQSSLSKETQSILLDFTRIVKVETDIEAGDLNDDAEHDFMEVCEYVRMAVLTLFDEHHKSEESPASELQESDRTLH